MSEELKERSVFKILGQFLQTFLTNPLDLEFTHACKIPTVITETLVYTTVSTFDTLLLFNV
jgi:branched-subunit amino acid transport protein